MFNNDLFILPAPTNHLTKEENKDYFIKYKNGDRKSRDILIIDNIGLVFYVLKLMNIYDTSYLKDFVSEGIIGLIKAVDSFDLSKNVDFPNYAIKCIRNQMLMFYKYKYIKHSTTDSLLSIDENDVCLKKETDPYLVYEQNDFLNRIMELFVNLPDRTREILKLYLGFYGKCYVTKEIGEMFGISQSYTSRLIRKTLSKIKSTLLEEGYTEIKEYIKY